MRFKHSEKKLKNDFRWSLLQIGIGSISLILDLFSPFFQYGWLTIGLLSLVNYFYEKNNYYLILENEILTVFSVFRKKRIILSHFKEIKKLKNSLLLKSFKRKERIQTWMTENGVQESLFFEIDRIITKQNNKS